MLLFSPCAFGSFCWQGVSASSDLVKTWHPQAAGTNTCLSLPSRFGAIAGPTGGSLWFVPHCSHIPGGCQVNICWPKCPNASHSWGSLRVCLLFIKRPQWVRESMNFRAGRDFNGDLVQPLHFINKETDPERRVLPKVKHLVLGRAGNETPSRGSFCFPYGSIMPHRTWSLPAKDL